MSEYKDRGIMKWAPFDALDGHGTMLEEMIYNINKKEKNAISDDEYEEINKAVNEAIEKDKFISIDYYFDGYTYSTFGKIKKIDIVKKQIELNTLETVDFDSILRIKAEN